MALNHTQLSGTSATDSYFQNDHQTRYVFLMHFLLFSKPLIIDKCVKCVPSDLLDINVPNVSDALRHNKPILC